MLAALASPELLIVSALIGWFAPRFWQILAAPVLLGIIAFVFGDPNEPMRALLLRIGPAALLVAGLAFGLRRMADLRKSG